jgi:hypothetical protein
MLEVQERVSTGNHAPYVSGLTMPSCSDPTSQCLVEIAQPTCARVSRTLFVRVRVPELNNCRGEDLIKSGPPGVAHVVVHRVLSNAGGPGREQEVLLWTRRWVRINGRTISGSKGLEPSSVSAFSGHRDQLTLG